MFALKLQIPLCIAGLLYKGNSADVQERCVPTICHGLDDQHLRGIVLRQMEGALPPGVKEPAVVKVCLKVRPAPKRQALLPELPINEDLYFDRPGVFAEVDSPPFDAQFSRLNPEARVHPASRFEGGNSAEVQERFSACA